MAQILVFPIGRAWEKLPRWRIPLGKLSFDLNPGKFTIKEHAFIVIVSEYYLSSKPCFLAVDLTNCSVSISVHPPPMLKAL